MKIHTIRVRRLLTDTFEVKKEEMKWHFLRCVFNCLIHCKYERLSSYATLVFACEFDYRSNKESFSVGAKTFVIR